MSVTDYRFMWPKSRKSPSRSVIAVDLLAMFGGVGVWSAGGYLLVAYFSLAGLVLMILGLALAGLGYLMLGAHLAQLHYERQLKETTTAAGPAKAVP